MPRVTHSVQILLLLLLVASLSFLHLGLMDYHITKLKLSEVKDESFFELIEQTYIQNASAKELPSETHAEVKAQAYINEVFFTTQAPLAEWDDPRQQDACEEASVLMAINWAEGNDSLTKEEARDLILKMSLFQEENYGVYKDSSAQDTYNWLVRGFFDYHKSRFQTKITVHDIIDEIYQGNLVIIPTNGQALKNPNFVGGGPPTHMILIIGYDPKKEQFITNDPGTRNGKNYVYSKKIIEKSIRDYGSGYHAFENALPTSMIVIAK